MRIGKKYGYLWITLILFLGSISAHWIFAWFSYIDEQKDVNKPIEFSGYLNQTMRDTMENWQSEFLQLIWQVGGLSFLWYVGSPSSKEGDERKEELMKEILRQVNSKDAEKIISDLEKKYPKKIGCNIPSVILRFFIALSVLKYQRSATVYNEILFFVLMSVFEFLNSYF